MNIPNILTNCVIVNLQVAVKLKGANKLMSPDNIASTLANNLNHIPHVIVTQCYAKEVYDESGNNRKL